MEQKLCHSLKGIDLGTTSHELQLLLSGLFGVGVYRVFDDADDDGDGDANK